MDAHLLHIEPGSSEPIYRQIVAQVRRLAAGGQLPAGTLMPSVRDMAAAHAINPMTVSKAWSLLEAEGVLERLRGRGMAVRAGASRTRSRAERLQLLQPALRAVAQQAGELELPAEAVLAELAHALGRADLCP